MAQFGIRPTPNDTTILGLSALGETLSFGLVDSGSVQVSGPISKVTLDAVLGAGASVAVTVNNGTVTPGSFILVQPVDAEAGASLAPLGVNVSNVSSGSFVLNVTNNGAAATDAAPAFFVLILGN